MLRTKKINKKNFPIYQNRNLIYSTRILINKLHPGLSANRLELESESTSSIEIELKAIAKIWKSNAMMII